MKGNKEVIEALNEVLAGELVAINQYFLHAKMCENWGFMVLAKKIRAESIDEMRHAAAWLRHSHLPRQVAQDDAGAPERHPRR